MKHVSNAWFKKPTETAALNNLDRQAEEERQRKAVPLRVRGFRVVRTKAVA